MELWQTVGVGLTSVIVAAGLSFVAAIHLERRKANTSQDERIADLEKTQGVLTVQVQPITAALQAMLVAQLTHFHTPVLDALLKKLEAGTLTPAEKKKMLTALKRRITVINGRIDDSERNAAEMLPLVIERADLEAAAASSPQMVQSVSIPVGEEEVPTWPKKA